MSDQALAAEQHRARLAHSESSPRRTRKGRRTFVVTGRHERRDRGVHPLLPDSAIDWQSGTVRDLVTGATHRADLASMADAWVRRFHPEALSEHHGGAAQCVCDDLTVPCLVLDRSDGYSPVYDPSHGTYEVREVPVRSCHCGFERLLGTDMGLSFVQMGPGKGKHGADYVTAYKGRSLAREAGRKRQARAARRDAAPPAPWAEEERVIAEALAADVDVITFPGVVVAVRRTAGSPMTVKLTRGDETIRFRARTAGAIARRVIA